MEEISRVVEFKRSKPSNMLAISSVTRLGEVLSLRLKTEGDFTNERNFSFRDLRDRVKIQNRLEVIQMLCRIFEKPFVLKSRYRLFEYTDKLKIYPHVLSENSSVSQILDLQPLFEGFEEPVSCYIEPSTNTYSPEIIESALKIVNTVHKGLNLSEYVVISQTQFLNLAENYLASGVYFFFDGQLEQQVSGVVTALSKFNLKREVVLTNLNE